MLKQVKVSQLSLLVISALGLSACSGLLYDNITAPVYNSVSAKKSQTTSSYPRYQSAQTYQEVAQGGSQNYDYAGYSQSMRNQQAMQSQQMQQSIENPNSDITDPYQSNNYTVTDTVRPNAVRDNLPQNSVEQATGNVTENVTSNARNYVDNKQQQYQTAQSSATNAMNEKINSAKAQAEATKRNAERLIPSAAQAKQEVSKVVDSSTKQEVKSSATEALLEEARKAVASNDLDKAASALERAHRITPKDAKILYDIAQIRYAQGKYTQAESFASKAATYAKSPSLSKKIWQKLSQTRQAMGNTTGAKTAAAKAASY